MLPASTSSSSSTSSTSSLRPILHRRLSIWLCKLQVKTPLYLSLASVAYRSPFLGVRICRAKFSKVLLCQRNRKERLQSSHYGVDGNLRSYGIMYNDVGVLQSRENLPPLLWYVGTTVLHDQQSLSRELGEVLCSAILNDSPSGNKQAKKCGKVFCALTWHRCSILARLGVHTFD